MNEILVCTNCKAHYDSYVDAVGCQRTVCPRCYDEFFAIEDMDEDDVVVPVYVCSICGMVLDHVMTARRTAGTGERYEWKVRPCPKHPMSVPREFAP